jgi:transketolase
MAQTNGDLVRTLEEKAVHIREMLLRYARQVGSAHLGGPLSMCDITVALYYHFMKYDPKNIRLPERDRFILSKGHCGDLLYNIFTDMGLFTLDELYGEYNKIDGRFGQHPNRFYLPMFEASTGSLGHGLSLAFGYAMAGRMDKAPWKVFCLTGDGELDEGSNWEAIMAIAHYKLGNVVLIVDRNRISGCRHTEETIALDSLEKKLDAFNWDVKSIDGNNMSEVVETLSALPISDPVTRRKPIAIVANTIKGKGVSFMEDQEKWHLGGLDDDKLQEALASLEASRKQRG